MKNSRARNFIAVALFAAMAFTTANARAATPITAEAAHAIAVDAYLYFYTPITMDLTRKQSVNIEPGKEFGKGPMNIFVNVPAYPPADMKVVVRVNFDTLYSIAWLDLTKEPQIVSVPDSHGRFYLLPMLDMWSDVFASPGSRTTGTKAGNFLVTPPGWSGTVPKGFSRIAAPTPYVWILKRAMVSQVGLGANLPEDAIYPLNLFDNTGKPLDGANKYTIHFDKGAAPPVNAFWSITLYDSDGFQVANELNRFAVSSWMPFERNSDGSLDLFFQNESPGKDKEANWLPAPKGAFNLCMRLYGPKSDALTGEWNPPPVVKATAPTGDGR